MIVISQKGKRTVKQTLELRTSLYEMPNDRLLIAQPKRCGPIRVKTSSEAHFMSIRSIGHDMWSAVHDSSPHFIKITKDGS